MHIINWRKERSFSGFRTECPLIQFLIHSPNIESVVGRQPRDSTSFYRSDGFSTSTHQTHQPPYFIFVLVSENAQRDTCEVHIS